MTIYNGWTKEISDEQRRANRACALASNAELLTWRNALRQAERIAALFTGYTVTLDIPADFDTVQSEIIRRQNAGEWN